MENKQRNYLTIFLIENSDNRDNTKEWRLGVRYHNNNWCNWRICYPRKISCRPLRLELYFTADRENGDHSLCHYRKTRLYPSCYFINMPNKYKTIKIGETYDHIIDITPWRHTLYAKHSVLADVDLPNDKERSEGTFSLIVTYPHVHHYAVGYLKWKGTY